jgi:hypothetical protein
MLHHLNLPPLDEIFSLLQNTDKVTHLGNTFITVLQRSFIGTQNYTLQMKVVTHSTCFVKCVTVDDYSNTKIMLRFGMKTSKCLDICHFFF